jgi:hypothetical protein
MAVSTIDPNGLNVGQFGNRNLIINGDFSISQRSTSVTGATSSGYATVDRWWHNASGGTQNMSQQSLAVGQTDLPSQFTKFFRFASTSGNNNQGFAQKIENVELLSGTTVTVSFYAKGTNPGAGSVELAYLQYFGSGGSANVEAGAYNITLTSSWQLFKTTISLPSVSGKTVGAGNSTYVYFRQGASDTSTAAWTMDITGVQLELGDTSTDFEHISYGDQLQKCQRFYYQKDYTINTYEPVKFPCWIGSTQTLTGEWVHPVTMRVPPTFSHNGVGNFRLNDSRGNDQVCDSITRTGGNVNETWLTFGGVNTSFTIGYCGYLNTQVANDAQITFDAEL